MEGHVAVEQVLGGLRMREVLVNRCRQMASSVPHTGDDVSQDRSIYCRHLVSTVVVLGGLNLAD